MDDARLDCHYLSGRLYRCLDDGDPAGAAALFAADGVWHRQGKALKGPAAIGEALSQRPHAVASCHVLSGIDATRSGPDAIEVRGIVTVYRQAAPVASAVMTIHDSFVREGDAWRLREKRGRVIMKAE